MLRQVTRCLYGARVDGSRCITARKSQKFTTVDIYLGTSYYKIVHGESQKRRFIRYDMNKICFKTGTGAAVIVLVYRVYITVRKCNIIKSL